MSSIKQDGAGGEVYSGQEVACSFVIACGNDAELLDLGEKILDQVARLVSVPIELRMFTAVGLGRDYRGFAGGSERIEDARIGVIGLIGDQRRGLHVRQKVVGAEQVVCLTAGQAQADRIAERINDGVDFSAQSPSRMADRLVLTIFF